MTAVQDDAVMAGPAAGLELLSTLSAPGTARRHVRGVLSGDGCSEDDVSSAVLLTSEVVTNAVLHGSAPIVLRLQHWGASLRVEVRDAGAAFGPVSTRSEDLTAEGGRGLALIESLATAWGRTVHDDVPIGKTVWFEIVRDPPRPSTSA
jgi:anti-sigma regulatory factor (Ser/Thr protein kinase)